MFIRDVHDADQTRAPEILCLSGHAARRCLVRGLSMRDIEDAAENGEVIGAEEGRRVIAHGRIRLIMSDDGMLISAWRKKKHNPKTALRKTRKKRIVFARALKRGEAV